MENEKSKKTEDKKNVKTKKTKTVEPTEKTKVDEQAKMVKADKTTEKCSNFNNIIVLLLAISVLANVYLLFQVNELNTEILQLKSNNPQNESNSQNMSTAVVREGDIVEVDYIGTFENGTVFDTSIEDKAIEAGIYALGREYTPLAFIPGKGQVIQGFEDAVIGMEIGEEKTITIPPEEGYSDDPTHPLYGKTLIFEIILIDIKEPTAVRLIVLNDQRCKDCDVSMLLEQLESIFPDLDVKELDYGSEEGKELYENLGIEYLPAILFDDSVKYGEGYPNVQGYLEQMGDYYSLRLNVNFDPTAEICDNGIDDNGDGLIDCDDLDCKDGFECREEKENNVQVFVMSDCPYGRMAIGALKEVVDNFGNAIDYEVHYIANEQGDGFLSLHGQYEVDEDIIQLCVKKYSPDAWLDYLYCRSPSSIANKDWKDCANEVNVDVDAVQTCFENDEGKELLREDIMIAQSLSIGASPTWIANNRYVFSGIDAETVKTNICRYNEGLEGCEKTLNSNIGAPSGTC